MKTGNSKNMVWVISFALLVAFALWGGFVIYKDIVNSTVQKEEVTEVPEIVEEKIEVEKKEKISRSKYEILVLNGSGIAGEAARGKELLESGDFVVNSIGNADTLDYTETIIQAGEEVSEEFIMELTNFLAETYQISSDTETGNDKASITIILGRLKK